MLHSPSASPFPTGSLRHSCCPSNTSLRFSHRPFAPAVLIAYNALPPNLRILPPSRFSSNVTVLYFLRTSILTCCVFFGVLFLSWGMSPILDLAGCFFVTLYNLFLESVPTIPTMLFPQVNRWLALPGPGSGQNILSPVGLGTACCIFSGAP